MRHTETYDLNLIETSDTFSPAPLNENMEKLEAIIAAGTSAEAQARAEADAALDGRVTALEARKIVVGTYTGSREDGWYTIDLGFTPTLVIAQPPGNLAYMIAQGGSCVYMEIVEGGFRVKDYLNNGKFNYLAIL